MAKEVTDREAAAEAVAVAAEVHAAKVSERYVEKFKGFFPKKQPVPDMGVAMRANAAALRHSALALVKASAAHDAELADDAEPREARDTAARQLAETMVAFRGAVDTVYGRAGLKALGIDGRTPAEPKPVLEHARKLAAQLQDPKLKLPKPQDGVSIDKGVWLARLDKALPALADALKAVAREEREAQVTSNAKSKAMEAFDELFEVVATFTSSMLELIDEDDLASRVKPSRRRRGVTAELEASDPAAPSPAPSGAPPVPA